MPVIVFNSGRYDPSLTKIHFVKSLKGSNRRDSVK